MRSTRPDRVPSSEPASVQRTKTRRAKPIPAARSLWLLVSAAAGSTRLPERRRTDVQPSICETNSLYSPSTRLPGSGSWQRGLQGRPLGTKPPAYENDRSDDGDQHDPDLFGELDERRALFLLAELLESSKKVRHFATPPCRAKPIPGARSLGFYLRQPGQRGCQNARS